MKKTHKILRKQSMAFLLLLSFGCSDKIVSFVNPKAKFNTFETYRMVNPKVDRSEIADDNNPVFLAIKSEIQEEMSRRNYRISSVKPDLTLRYEVTSSTRVQNDAMQDPFSPFMRVNSRTIHEGILLLELYDVRKKLVWQGSYDLKQERKEKKLKRVIKNAVGKIFTTYPHKALTSSPDPQLTVFKKDK